MKYTFFWRFALEFFVSTGLFVFRLPRRKLFPVRLLLCMGVFLLLSWLLAWERYPWFSEDLTTQEWSYYTLLKALRYIVLYLTVCGCIYACFQESEHAAIMHGTCGYMTQHFTRKLYNIFHSLWIDTLPIGWQIALYLCIMATCLGALYFLFARKISEISTDDPPKTAGLYFVLTITLSVYSNFISAVQKRMSFYGQTLINLYGATCSMLLLYFLLKIEQKNTLSNQFNYEKLLWKQQKKQLELSREMVDLLHIKYHDIKHRLDQYPAASGQNIDYANQLLQACNLNIYTGCDDLDLILTQNVLLCTKQRIQFNYMADGALLHRMPSEDVFSLFGNLLDNAVEAAARVEEPDRRRIDFKMTKQKNSIFVHVENTYAGEIAFQNGLPVTDKESSFHGYGMRSVRIATQKYGGYMTIDAKDGIFSVNILLPPIAKK